MPQGHYRLAAIFFERYGHQYFRRPVPLHSVVRRRNHVPLRVRKIIRVDKLRLWNDLAINDRGPIVLTMKRVESVNACQTSSSGASKTRVMTSSSLTGNLAGLLCLAVIFPLLPLRSAPTFILLDARKCQEAASPGETTDFANTNPGQILYSARNAPFK
jgi:hypothetical protein